MTDEDFEGFWQDTLTAELQRVNQGADKSRLEAMYASYRAWSQDPSPTLH